MSLTWERRGLDLTNRSIASELARLNDGSRFVLLIHGFNNDEADARANYDAVVTHLAALGVPGHRLQRIWQVYWPGYVEAVKPRLGRRVAKARGAPLRPVRQSNETATAARYSAQVHKARKLGGRIAEALVRASDRRRTLEVVLIAHSLGCRIVLEIIRELATAGMGHARLVVGFALLAAAVPTPMLERGGRLRSCVPSASRGQALYSPRDRALGLVFGLGQTWAARSVPEEGRFPDAVGKHGEPKIWGYRHNTYLGHGDYWSSRWIATHLARLLGVVTAIEIPDLSVVDWDLPEPLSLPTQALPDRRLEPDPERLPLAG